MEMPIEVTELNPADDLTPVRLATAADVAEVLGVHRTTILRLARQRAIPAYVAGRIVRFDVEEVLQVLREKRGRWRRTTALRSSRVEARKDLEARIARAVGISSPPRERLWGVLV